MKTTKNTAFAILYIATVIAVMLLTSCGTTKKTCWKQNKSSNYIPKIVKTNFKAKKYSI